MEWVARLGQTQTSFRAWCIKLRNPMRVRVVGSTVSGNFGTNRRPNRVRVLLVGIAIYEDTGTRQQTFA